jgi:hypothetical protein
MTLLQIIQALTLITSVSQAYQEMYTLIQKAKAENRELSPDELLDIDKKYNASFDDLDAAITEAEEKSG